MIHVFHLYYMYMQVQEAQRLHHSPEQRYIAIKIALIKLG